jgi:hypothetical protein
MKKKVVVVIPIYQQKLKPTEVISLKRCIEVLGSHPIVFVKPNSLNPSYLADFQVDIVFENFEDRFFKSTSTYNELLISIPFYKRFADYEFMLIYQLDAYVFEDKLLDWCQKDYDYIGAPKLKLHHYKRSKGQFSVWLKPTRFNMNGGLSLRKNSAMISFLKIFHRFYKHWPANEDALFSIYHQRIVPLRPFLKLPEWKIALDFSFEKNPTLCFSINKNKLPFACHAWERYSPKFWEKFVK